MWKIDRSGCSCVVVEQTTEPLLSTYATDTPFRKVTVNQLVVETLMISLAMIVGDEFRDSLSVMAFAERNQAIETFLLDRADEPFGIGVGIRRPIRCLDDTNPRVLQLRSHRPTPLGIAVADQHATFIAVRERERPHDLAHKRLIGMWRRAEDPDAEMSHKSTEPPRPCQAARQ